MSYHGFLRVAAASPRLKVAECGYNAAQIRALYDSERYPLTRTKPSL